MTRTTSSGALLAVARPLEPTVRSNVRAALDTFVGREAELARVRAMLTDEGARLVTVLGVAGAGKTRLARVVASGWLGPRAASPFDEIWWIELGTAQSRADVLAEIGLALEVETGDGDDAHLDLIAQALSGRGRVLLVLDELDELVEHAGVLVDLLARSPACCVLTTSRVALGASGEHGVELGSLTTLDDAVRLLHDRAQARRPGVVAGDATRQAIERVAELLDRLPLSLELAAALLAIYDAPALVRRLERGQDVLRATDAGRPSRHRSLYRALASSWDRLDTPAQQALAACTTFAGAFDAEAAEAVIGVGVEGIDQLGMLLSSSLVQRETLDDGRVRLSLYQGVRQFVDQVAGADVLDAARRRHLLHFAERGRRWGAELSLGQPRPDVLHAIVDARANLRAALATATDPARAIDDEVLAAAMDCAHVLAFDVRRREGLRQLDAVVVAPVLGLLHRHGVGASLPTRIAALVDDCCVDVEALAGQLAPAALGTWIDLTLLIGGTLHAASRRKLAERWLTLAEQLAARVGDDLRLGRVAFERALRLRAEGRLEDGVEATERALAHFERTDATALAVQARSMLGLLAHTAGDLDQAERIYLDALREATALELESLGAFLGAQLAAIAWRRGQPVEARRRLAAALVVQQRTGERRQEATTQTGLARMALDLGDLEAARAHSERALELHARMGQRAPLAASQTLRVLIEIGHRDINAAHEHLTHLRSLLDTENSPRDALVVCRMQLRLDVARGDLEGALARAEPWLERAASAGGPNPGCELRVAAVALAGLLGRRTEAERHLQELEALDLDRLDHAHRTLCEVAPAFVALASGPCDTLDDARAAVIRRGFAAAFVSSSGRASVYPSDGVRFWMARLDAALPATLRAAAWADALDPGGEAIVVADDGLVRLPDGEMSDLGRRRTVARVLWALIDHRRHGCADSVLDHDSLLEAGWPGERMLPDAALNRLHKTLSMVRKLGLRDHIELVEDGYRLSPSLEVLSVPPSFEAWWRAARCPSANTVSNGLRVVSAAPRRSGAEEL